MTRGQRTRRHLVLAGVLSALPGVAYAQSDIELAADVAGNIGYSTNPFTEIGDDTGSGVADIQVRPRATLRSERSVIVLSGSAQYQKYFRRYNDAQNYQAALDYSGTPSEHLTTHLGVTYDNSILGSNRGFVGPFDPTLPETPTVIGSDLALFGTRDRRSTIGVNGDLSFVLSPRDTITPSAYFVRSRYRRFSQGNYDGYGGTLAYSRQISERLQLGLQGSASKYDYQGLAGDSTVYTVRGTGSYTFSPRWKVNGAVGVSLTETSVGVNYSNRVSERGRIFASAAYSKNGNNNPLLLFGGNEYISATVGYERSINERLRMTANTRYRDVFGFGGNRGADYGGQVGVTYKIGDNR